MLLPIKNLLIQILIKLLGYELQLRIEKQAEIGYKSIDLETLQELLHEKSQKNITQKKP